MEKVARSRNKFLKFYLSRNLLKFLPPRAAPAITNPFSPKKDKRSDVPIKHKSHLYKGFSGPIISIVPEEARRKIHSASFRTHEPTSPEVSCMGQIKKHKRKTKIITKDKHVSLPTNFKPENSHYEAKKKALGFGKLFGGAWPHGRKFDDSKGKPSNSVDRTAPGLGQMKRLPSRRNSLKNFDWTAQIAPVDGDYGLDYFSDEESEGEEKEVIIPFSAPIILVGGGGRVALEPKKEINLWKRRTMPQPRPLQVH
ncbi:uncharacterized protein At1g76070-like [Rhododendron vialii]|uniref:uncharacterized protein At1g76070-like n=1 Tax=Rhododendron vialii TaxID=182163 RepID=UPI0026604982|nr:uncharacterized protein At1g76070-like [Rhododendron vialii]